MNRMMMIPGALGALLLGLVPACAPTTGDVDLDNEMGASADLSRPLAEGRIDAAPAQVVTEALVAGSDTLARYEALVAAKAPAAPGQPFAFTEEKPNNKLQPELVLSKDFILELSVPKTDWILGEPVTVRATVTNVSDKALQVAPLVDTMFDQFKLTVTTPDGTAMPYMNIVQACTLPTLAVRTFQPGESFSNELRLVAPKTGWMFDEPGEYTLEARLKGMTPSAELMVAEPIELTVLAGNEAERAAAELVMHSEAARLLEWQDGDQFVQGRETLEAITRLYPESIHAVYAGNVLGNMWANDFYQISGTRAADPKQAVKYLAPVQRRLIEPGAPVVAWDVVANVHNTLAKSYAAMGQVDLARATLDTFISSFGRDPNQAQAVAEARELRASL